jgi:hypothetical protein
VRTARRQKSNGQSRGPPTVRVGMRASFRSTAAALPVVLACALPLQLGCTNPSPAANPAHSSRSTEGTGVVDFRERGLVGPVLDQGFVGACTAFGVAAVMNNHLRQAGRTELVSTMHVWAELKLHNGMTTDMLNVAIAPAEAWTYDPVKACLIATPDDECASAGYAPGSGQLDPRINLEWVRANLASRYRVTTVESVYGDGQPKDERAIYQALSRGEALDATILAEGPFFDLRSDVVPHYSLTDARVGHAVALVGFRTLDGERQILLQNSWGPRWGDGGFAWLPEDMLATHVNHARRLVIADATLPPRAANGRCDQGRLDQVQDACYEACRTGVATIAGRCNPMPLPAGVPPSCLDLRALLAGACLPASAGGGGASSTTVTLPTVLESLPWPTLPLGIPLPAKP